ncbi:unnamed protein product [Schistosoma margrebowiei]|uniref:DUF4203 domain-containing protein n=2 Tax=Schistosoma margrebowiei TaxID=48269 RepID=A0AA84ZNK8_9TREM|nr:unnamed protein product [Schistosoma margrebowiei]
MLWVVLCPYLLLTSGYIQECISHTIITIEHGSFTNISVNGLVYVEVIKIPPGSKFAVYQVHSPFNPLLVSTSASFTYDTSQYSAHCGLASFVENKTLSTFYVYSSYSVPLIVWVKAVAYGSEFPLPGGCGRSSRSGFMNAAITTDIMTKNINLSSSKRIEFLSYWTSALQLSAASEPVGSGGFACSHWIAESKPSGSLVYHVYGTPLITAGGSYGAFVNPSPSEVASVLKNMANFGHSSFVGTYIQSFHQSEFTPNDEFINIIVSRRPATAYIVTVVVEYSVSGDTWQVPYIPVILFGCPAQISPSFYRTVYNQPTSNASLVVNCGTLPKDTPVILFPVAVLLLAGFLYATSCNMWIWPRCAVSAMIMGSVIGLIFFYRFSDEPNETYLILIASAFLPAFFALFVFVILWWRYVRPTLYYQRMFGQGPLVKVENSTTVLVNEPWNSDVLDNSYQNVVAPFGSSSQTEHTPINTVNVLAPVNEEESSISALQLCHDLVYQHSPAHSGAYVSNEQGGSNDNEDYTCVRICGIQLCRRSRSSQKSSKTLARPLKPFTLRPRRFARLLPVLPTVFILIGYLSISLDRSLKLDKSSVSFFAFCIIMSGLLLGLLSIFKNFAFGISTALFGFYVTLCCASFFLIPSCLLPHIVIEYFLMLTCFDIRLRTLRIQFYGQYDVIVVVIWFVSSICFGSLALCLIRLQDARELSEAQNYHTSNSKHPYTNTNAHTPSNSLSLLGEIRPSSQASCYVPRMFPVPSLSSNANSASSLYNLLSSPKVYNKIDSEGSVNYPVLVDYCRPSNPSSSRVSTEKQPLLQGSFYNKYGGLMGTGTGHPPLLPLSRVQLAAASQSLPFSSSSSVNITSKSIHSDVEEN